MGSLIPPGPVDPWLFFYNLQDCCVWLSLCSFVILLTGIQSFVYFLSFRTSTQRGEVTSNLENLVPKWVYVVIADSWSWISSYKSVAVSLRCQQFLYFRLLEHSHLESREPFCMSHTVVLAPVEYVVLTLFIYEKKNSQNNFFVLLSHWETLWKYCEKTELFWREAGTWQHVCCKLSNCVWLRGLWLLCHLVGGGVLLLFSNFILSLSILNEPVGVILFYTEIYR